MMWRHGYTIHITGPLPPYSNAEFLCELEPAIEQKIELPVISTPIRSGDATVMGHTWLIEQHI